MFPLTLTLSPSVREREPQGAPLKKFNPTRSGDRLTPILPLPC